MITPNQLADVIVKIITNHQLHRPKIININNKNLSSKGDISFQLNLNHWRGYVNVESDCFKNSKNILQYFMRRKLNDPNLNLTDENILEVLEKYVVDKIQQIYKNNLLFTMHISKDFVLINYKRSVVSYNAIKKAIEQGDKYGKTQGIGKKIKLKVETDDESEITSARLNLIKKISENLLIFQNHNLQNEECDNNYIYTIKSKGTIDNDYTRCLCGAVLNSSKKKERNLKQDMYVNRKIEKIKKLNSQKCSDLYVNENNIEKDITKIANASIVYELLSCKQNSPVVIDNSDNLDRSVKEASFILYNNVRINTILDKYAQLVLENNFPQIIPIEKMESFNTATDEESWSLIYNYIIKYPDVLNAATTVEPKLDVNTQLLWSFVSNLCHDFSKYYRRNRILMRGVDSNNEIVLMTTERLHMLKALRNVLHNSLLLLGIEEVTCM